MIISGKQQWSSSPESAALSEGLKFPEIIIGLVSPVGTDIQKIVQSLTESFKVFEYAVFHIKLSDEFRKLAEDFNCNYLANISEMERIHKYIEFGNKLRLKFGNDCLAKFAITKIIKNRNDVFEKKIYIINQLKTTKEIEFLTSVYGKAFFQLSVYSARDIRVDYLSKKLAKTVNKRDSNRFRAKAEELVNRDENENLPYGQEVGKIFQLADVVINIDKQEENPVNVQINRFVKLLFGNNSLSPNRMEYGMYLAHSAALRSLDLSRQVGAAIFRSTGEIATLGSNEVPKAGGGSYWTDEHYDAREFKKQIDSNDERKKELLNEVITILGKSMENLDVDTNKKLIESQFMDALEYGRIIHAEMSAITDAARLGICLKEATLYCTTFPCHMCSKHIVASGIKKVVFLEPYPKSLTSDMHSDSVKIEGASRERYKSFPAVDFVPFYGITPARYREFFSRKKRKGKTGFIEYKDELPLPIFSPFTPSYTDSEKFYGEEILNNLENYSIKLKS